MHSGETKGDGLEAKGEVDDNTLLISAKTQEKLSSICTMIALINDDSTLDYRVEQAKKLLIAINEYSSSLLCDLDCKQARVLFRQKIEHIMKKEGMEPALTEISRKDKLQLVESTLMNVFQQATLAVFSRLDIGALLMQPTQALFVADVDAAVLEEFGVVAVLAANNNTSGTGGMSAGLDNSYNMKLYYSTCFLAALTARSKPSGHSGPVFEQEHKHEHEKDPRPVKLHRHLIQNKTVSDTLQQAPTLKLCFTMNLLREIQNIIAQMIAECFVKRDSMWLRRNQKIYDNRADALLEFNEEIKSQGQAKKVLSLAIINTLGELKNQSSINRHTGFWIFTCGRKPTSMQRRLNRLYRRGSLAIQGEPLTSTNAEQYYNNTVNAIAA